MPSRETLEAFIARVEQGKFDAAIEEFYAEDASMQKKPGAVRRGRDHLVAHERSVMTRFKEIRAQCVRPVFCEGDRVIVRWLFEFAGDNGAVIRLDELAYQRWQGEKMVEERFYYDPAPMKSGTSH